MNISVSEGETELEPGGNPLDWKAVARLHPCIVKRLRTMVCGREFSTNLKQRGEEIEKNEKLLDKADYFCLINALAKYHKYLYSEVFRSVITGFDK